MTVGATYFRRGATVALRVLAVCRDYKLRVLAVLTRPKVLSISDVRTAGTACTRGSVLLELPILPVFEPSALLILPVLAVFKPPVL